MCWLDWVDWKIFASFNCCKTICQHSTTNPSTMRWTFSGCLVWWWFQCTPMVPWSCSVEEGQVYVSYMKRSDRKGARWLFPDEADVHETQAEQILLQNLQVSYCLTAMIRCELSTKTLQTISDLFDKCENSQNMKD